MCWEQRGCASWFVYINMSTAVAFFVLLLLRGNFANASLWCYECGTHVTGEPDCSDFSHATTWTQFWRECSDDSICVKILPAWPSERNDLDTVRGCAPRTNHRGVEHQEGCWSHPTASHSLACFCKTDFCNAAHVTTPLLPTLFSVLGAVLVLIVR
ncbi:uncharacterized protein LOC123499168 [Portunus trituberculatus]|uniref:Uncharacterized protein n=1 Tax=Portunus trituberculatus TaxID=210409 RepID=A0A5B7DT99_PORTR|nr:uncharacterized protein LOC123499168 [Portunus trituberculatus]MPC24233.1 hypothetical protein [Portunus trituberculatus]